MSETKETSSHSTYTSEMGDRICAEMIGGEDGRPKSLATVLKLPGMPCKRTVMNWIVAHPEFEKIYRIAQQERAEVWIEEIVDIADDRSHDYYTDDEGRQRVDTEHINRSRLKVDTRKWIAAKMMPKLYGERVTAELTGANGGPIQTADMTESEIARRIAFTLASGLKQPEQVH
jgi:hypothetical protein